MGLARIYPFTHFYLVILFIFTSLVCFVAPVNSAPADGIVTWSGVDKDSSVSLANGDLDALVSGSAGAGVFGVRSSSPIASGDGFFYFEIEQLVSQYGFAIGVASASAPLASASDIETFVNDNISGDPQTQSVMYDTYVGVVGVAVDYRGGYPIIYFVGNNVFDQLPDSVANVTSKLELTSVTEPLYIYVMAGSGGQYRLNFGGENGADFDWDPVSELGTFVYNIDSVLEYGWPIAVAKPSLNITEGSQLVDQNGSVTFNASAIDSDSSNIAYSVNWYLNGVSIGTGDNVTPSSSVSGIFELMAQVTDSIGLTSTSKADFYVHPSTDGDGLDQDMDGLTYSQELAESTDPGNFDSDGDGLSDGYEVANGSDPLVVNAPISIEPHLEDVYLKFEPEKTSPIISTSDDGLSVGYISVGGKGAIRANQGMKGEFRYWEGRALFDADMGFGLINPDEKLDDYCCVTSDIADPEAPGASMSVNTYLGNSVWRNLVFQAGFGSNDEYIGFAVDYTADEPIVYVIGSTGIQAILTLSDYPSADPIFPLMYGNAGEVEGRGAAPVQQGNFGQEPFFYDVQQVLSTATDEGVPLNIDTTNFVPGWGKYRQLQHLFIDSSDQSVEVDTSVTFNATATDALGVDATAAITWTILNSSSVDVTADIASVAPPVTGGSLTLTPLIADTYTVSAQITDSKTGQVFSRSVVVIANPVSGDTTPPVLSNIPSDLSVVITSGSTAPATLPAIASFLSAPTATDDSGIVSLTNDAPANFPLGDTDVTFTAEDGANNQATSTATVTVTFSDVDDPVVTAPSDLGITITSGSSVPVTDAQIVAFLAAATATDNVGVVAFTNDAPTSFPVGDTTVTFTATDAAGRTGTATADVTITFTDIDDPVVTAPGDLAITINSGSSVPATDSRIEAFLAAASATDNVGVVTFSNDASTSFSVGTTTVTFTATDAAGHTGTATADVTITFTDIDDPVVTAPGDLAITINSGSSVPVTDAQIVAFLAAASATDNVGVAIFTNDAPTSFPVGTTTVTFTAIDAAGHTGTATADVTITFMDIEAPVVTAPSDVSITITSGNSVPATDARIVAFLAGASATDNVGVVSLTNDAPASFPVGDTTVTFTAADVVGLTGAATATVTVTDRGLPTISTPNDITVTSNGGASVPSSSAAIVAFLNSAIAVDDVDSAISVLNNAPTAFLEGITTVTFTAVDAAGNAAEPQTALVHVVTTILDSGADSDGDGVSDMDEGLGDVDGDRIPDYLEDNSDPDQNESTQIQAGHNNAFLQTTAGLVLILGETSFASENASAQVVQDNLSANGGIGGTPIGNAIDEFFEYPAGMYDFEVRGLSAGASAQIVIPVSRAIPAGAVYRKYTRADGWRDFDLTTDQVASAPGSLGVCPAPGDAAYSAGLTPGNYCVQLTIQDGGANDADGLADGIIQDPGGIAVFIAAPNIGLNRSTTSTAFARNSGEQVVLAFSVSSDSTDAEINSLTISATGDLDEVNDVTAVRLYRDENEDGIADSTELLGSNNFVNDDGQITFTLSTPYRLPIGDTQLLVTYEF